MRKARITDLRLNKEVVELNSEEWQTLLECHSCGTQIEIDDSDRKFVDCPSCGIRYIKNLV